jgi:hypothetical protein
VKHSDSIAKLAAALVAAQKDIKGVGKDSINPHFKNKYASLDSIIDMVRPALAKHGLAVIQGATTPHTDEAGVVRCFTVETMLVHESGEWITNGAVLPVAKADPQGAGAALTYGRRYSLSALLSISTDEDDDGNHAAIPTTQHHDKRPPVAEKVTASRAERAMVNANKNGDPADKLMPFGKTKGKRLGDHTVEELQKTADWCNDKDAAKFADLIAAIDQHLEDRGIKAVLATGDDDNLPF